MEIRDVDSARFVRLEPLRYEFPDLVGGEHDSDWLVIGGQAQSDDEEWSFEDPSLLVREAEALGEWMRAAARREAPILVPDTDGDTWPTTDTLEPNLGFGVVRYGSGAVTVRAFFQLESAPRNVGERGKQDGSPCVIDLTTTCEALEHAADDWATALAAISKRG
jgi:hypothetical protein